MTKRPSVTISVSGGGKVEIEDCVSEADAFVENSGGTVDFKRVKWRGKRLPDGRA